MCNRHIYFSETCTVSLKYRFRLQIRFEKHRFHCSEHEFALHWFAVQFIDSFADFVQFNCTCAPPAEMPSMQKSVLRFRTFPGTFSIKSAWKKVFVATALSQTLSIFPYKNCLAKKNSFHPHFPRHFQNVHKKCLAKKCSLNPHVPRHILYFHKKVPGKKFIYFRTSPGT